MGKVTVALFLLFGVAVLASFGKARLCSHEISQETASGINWFSEYSCGTLVCVQKGSVVLNPVKVTSVKDWRQCESLTGYVIERQMHAPLDRLSAPVSFLGFFVVLPMSLLVLCRIALRMLKARTWNLDVLGYSWLAIFAESLALIGVSWILYPMINAFSLMFEIWPWLRFLPSLLLPGLNVHVSL